MEDLKKEQKLKKDVVVAEAMIVITPKDICDSIEKSLVIAAG